MKNLYIAGPMSGIQNQNREAFLEAEADLWDECEWDSIFNPTNSVATGLMRQGKISGETAYRTCMAEDLKFICEKATHIYMLKGWEASPGARAEHATAVCLGLKIMYEV